MKHKHPKRRKICDSWYHQRWFRILLIVVAVDMIMLGGAFALGLDVLSMLGEIHIILRVLGGAMYVLVALFIIHYAMSYREMKKETYFVCHHCAHD
ncbi:MAG: hypothetical protein MRY57_00175 [Candidatus Pacebacteria bacterium]|nr:hypothetical protein [Candidatus Paceibacterota bacterium]